MLQCHKYRACCRTRSHPSLAPNVSDVTQSRAHRHTPIHSCINATPILSGVCVKLFSSTFRDLREVVDHVAFPIPPYVCHPSALSSCDQAASHCPENPNPHPTCQSGIWDLDGLVGVPESSLEAIQAAVCCFLSHSSVHLHASSLPPSHLPLVVFSFLSKRGRACGVKSHG
jgi:hypothetical protein